jgi:hypothetical protein
MYRSKCTALRDYAGLRDAGIKNIYKLGKASLKNSTCLYCGLRKSNTIR